jgi:UDPglucose 6-dehydrogenase
MNLAVIGSGYVGLVTGACFADLGNRVICVDNDQGKIAQLRAGKIPIYEPGLPEMVERNVTGGRLSFTTEIAEAVDASTVIFIAVGTPPKESGEADLSAVEQVAAKVAERMRDYKLVVEKSTVPVKTGSWLKRTMALRAPQGVPFDVASNPEFLREGTAIQDFLHPDRIVVGVESERAGNLLRELYSAIKAPLLVTDIQSAELIKHASNSFLAMKISFANALSVLCEASGADILQVAQGIGMDQRIGRSFLDAGAGFGGFCFPKDLQAFIRIAEELGYDFKLLKDVYEINEQQKLRVVKKIKDGVWNLKGKTIALLGLAFKPNTDDMRFAPSLDIIKALKAEEAVIKAYDPVAMGKAKDLLGDSISYAKDAYQAAQDAHAVALVTEWPEFRELDWAKIKKLVKTPILVDARNCLDPEAMTSLGFLYQGIGRPLPRKP